MYQLTWLAPHNKLGDGDCQHLLIIPMVKILSVMSFPSIFPPGHKTRLHVMRGEDHLPSQNPILCLRWHFRMGKSSMGEENHLHNEKLQTITRAQSTDWKKTVRLCALYVRFTELLIISVLKGDILHFALRGSAIEILI